MNKSNAAVPYFHAWCDTDDSKREQWHVVWGLRLMFCTVNRGKDRSHAEADIWLSHVDILRSFQGMVKNKSLALRYHWLPGDAKQSGKLRVSLFGKVSGIDKDVVNADALAFCNEVYELLTGSLPDLGWSVISDAAVFKQYWNAMPWNKAHVAEIHRKILQEDFFHSPPVRPSLIRDGKTGEDTTEKKLSIHCVHPFRPQRRSLSRLLRVLTLSRQALVWQVNLKPSSLKEKDRKVLRQAVQDCEHAIVKAGSNKAGDKSLSSEKLQLVANTNRQQLLQLEQGALRVNVLIASPKPISDLLLNTFGVEISEPVTVSDTASLAGGFSIHQVVRKDLRCLARRCVSRMEFHRLVDITDTALVGVNYQLMDAHEASGAFRFPYTFSGDLQGIHLLTARKCPFVEPDGFKQVKGATLLGVNNHHGHSKIVSIPLQDRLLHTYVMGQTGTGKTTLLKNMIFHDMQEGHGVAMIDPHGDLFEDLLCSIPEHRRKDVVVFDPIDQTHPVGMNLLDCPDPEQRYFVVREMKSIMHRLLKDQYNSNASEFAGPIFYQHMQMNLLLAMSNPEDPGTLLEFYQIFQSNDYWKRWKKDHYDDPQLERWVKGTLSSMRYLDRNSDYQSYGEYLSCKFDDFVFDPKLRRIFGQKKSLDFQEIMNENKILLINLAKGALTEANANFLGMILLAKFQSAAMSRINQPAARRKPFFLYVDEFQNFATENFSLMLSEARKFGLGLVLANQFLSQIDNNKIKEAVFGNVGTTIAFRSGMKDASLLEDIFLPTFDKRDLVNLPNWTACVKATVCGQSLQPFTLHTLADATKPSKQLKKQVVAYSRKQYGRYYKKIDREIAKNLEK